MVRIRQGADPDLIARLADGYHAAIAMSWTDYAALPGRDAPAAVPLLGVDGLRRAAALIVRLREEGSTPTGDRGMLAAE